MSLADLYKKDIDTEEEREEGEEDFVPDHSSGSGSDSSEGEEKEGTKEESKEEIESKKRRIDAIWDEMNTSEFSAKEDEEKPEKKTKQSEKEPPVVKTPPPVPPPPEKKIKRRASKFSKMAEVVESRRAKKENTLEKARRDWTGFVKDEGIREDLDHANKDGYVERQQFLRRVDTRTYDKSRQPQHDINRGKRQK